MNTTTAALKVGDLVAVEFTAFPDATNTHDFGAIAATVVKEADIYTGAVVVQAHVNGAKFGIHETAIHHAEGCIHCEAAGWHNA